MKDESFLEFIREQLSGIDGLMIRPMFGAHGLYARDTFFGIVCKGQLFLKTNDKTAIAYRRRGMEPFKPSARQTIRTYYEVPADVIEDRGSFVKWAERAIAVGRGKAK